MHDDPLSRMEEDLQSTVSEGMLIPLSTKEDPELRLHGAVADPQLMPGRDGKQI